MLDAARSSASSEVSLPCDVKRPRLELFCSGQEESEQRFEESLRCAHFINSHFTPRAGAARDRVL